MPEKLLLVNLLQRLLYPLLRRCLLWESVIVFAELGVLGFVIDIPLADAPAKQLHEEGRR